MFEYLEDIIYSDDTSIKDVLDGFSKTAEHTENKGFGIVVNKAGRCLGVVTDGDVRRKLIKGINIESSVTAVMNESYSFVSSEEDSHNILRQFDKRIGNLPVLDKKGTVVDLYCYSSFSASSRTSKVIIRARVPLRVSFSGGGTDLSPYINRWPTSVLSSTINKYCTTSIIVRDDKKIHILSRDLDLRYEANSLADISFGDRLDLIKAAIKVMEPDYGFEIETYSETEEGTGLGGSSAIVVSVLGALNYFRNERQLDVYELSDLAYQVERIDMNIRGGWQDQYSTAFGGFNWIEFRQKEVVVSPFILHNNTLLELEYNLMLFRIGDKRNSSLIQEKNIEKNISSEAVENAFTVMNRLSNEIKEALLKGNVKMFGDLLHDAWILKKKMNPDVSDRFIDECYTTARKLGALGGKLLGAGGGGYLLLYASPLYQKAIVDAMSGCGVERELFKFSRRGLEVWSTKK